jgi:hypothetical protein
MLALTSTRCEIVSMIWSRWSSSDAREARPGADCFSAALTLASEARSALRPSTSVCAAWVMPSAILERPVAVVRIAEAVPSSAVNRALRLCWSDGVAAKDCAASKKPPICWPTPAALSSSAVSTEPSHCWRMSARPASEAAARESAAR